MKRKIDQSWVLGNGVTLAYGDEYSRLGCAQIAA
jgi:hypothetical protein